MEQGKKNQVCWIGLIGLVITIVLNLVALLILKKTSAEFFSDKWWSYWFPVYIAWFVFIAIGLTGCCKQKSSDTKQNT